MSMSRTLIDKYDVTGSRADIRRRLVLAFLDELPGRGTSELVSRYRYHVEKLSDGQIMYLDRPARFNNGFDFTIHVSDTQFNAKGPDRTRPSHNRIIADLVAKKKANPTAFRKLMLLIERIYKCDEISDAEVTAHAFSTGYPVEVVIKTLKWLFIEQDITYWNYAGREKLYGAICEAVS